MEPKQEFFLESNLLSRLTTGLQRRPRKVVFLVGSPLSAPHDGHPGVPVVDGIIEMIRQEFVAEELSALDLEIADSDEHRYQSAFRFLLANRGPSVSNEIVRRAVISARYHLPPQGTSNTDEYCRFLEQDLHAWSLSPATEALGRLIVDSPTNFGDAILTTNFDPLVEIAVWRAGGQLLRTTLHTDGNLNQSQGTGCHVVHLHGYWYGSDTLHTTRQLSQHRPRLKASLSSLLREKLVVVLGYGGWDDVFTSALVDVVADDQADSEIIWCSYSSNPNLSPGLATKLQSGIDRGRLSIYADVDCNKFLPKLQDFWVTGERETPALPAVQPITAVMAVAEPEDIAPRQAPLLEGDAEDRPPLFDFCLGRDLELSKLQSPDWRCAFITGIGGQGKSVIAAKYFEVSRKNGSFDYLVWRDCKEESERFETQLASVLETLTGGTFTDSYLSRLAADDLIAILEERLPSLSVLFVFDNIDHLVNYSALRLTSMADRFVTALIQVSTKSRAIFTCRPNIDYTSAEILSLPLAGLSEDVTVQLFGRRDASASREEIYEAHQLTGGNALWLDVLAAQIKRRYPDIHLADLTSAIRNGKGDFPSSFGSIWEHLHEREKILLRAMAETVRPESESQLGSYVSRDLGYKDMLRALRALRTMNLVVIKVTKSNKELFELHPLLRTFVRQKFTPQERQPFIHSILVMYQKFIGFHVERLKTRPTLQLLQNWTQAAELDLQAGYIQDAISRLMQCRPSFEASAFIREHVRVARLLLEAFDWPAEGANHKGFDPIFAGLVHDLASLGQSEEVHHLLNEFGRSVEEKDSRYIRYCEMQAFCAWLESRFDDALFWAQSGQALLEESGADLETDLLHTLALAQRDSGQPEVALTHFSKGRDFDDLLSTTEDYSRYNAPHYGNIGRCLHFMGNIDGALICYQKSALLLEQDDRREHVMNQGYIRRWIGEALLARSQTKLAVTFLEAARHKWEGIAPIRMRALDDLEDVLEKAVVDEVRRMNKAEVERQARAWILRSAAALV